MKNYETEAAWEYHGGTKHPNGILLNRLHTYHPANRPYPYKKYRNARQIMLSLDRHPTGISALDAISDSVRQYKGIIPDVNLLSRILYFSGGITKTIKFSPPLGEVEFRAASCTGALYHIEMYIVCSDVPGLEAGVYHFDPKNMSLSVLRKGDYRRVIADATADDSSMSRYAVTLVFTDVFSRNAVKYQAREYRHAFWDCGTMLANSLAMASAHRVPYKITMGFVDYQVNQLLGLDEKKEASLALLSLGNPVQYSAGPLPLDKIAESEALEYDFDLTAINDMHESSSLTSRQEVSAWRNQADQKVLHTDKKENSLASHAGADEGIEQTIISRGSTRKFSHDSISQEQLSTILATSTKGIVSDFENVTINDVYLIANAVDGVEKGAYFYNKKESLLKVLQKGEMRHVAGHLGLDQSLPFDASVAIFFMADLQKVLQQFGNRGYRVAQMDASIMAGRMYLASYALRIGATGLTFYDDEVTDFFSPHASNKSAMFMLAIGKKARKT
ncbi:MAG: SagB/ThcOx family dehydrogenase [Thaumarchaeota archaeon]|nr:SagB/ThcOx family dehydrogenase [Nitrososphaerota archaeon]